MTVAGVRGLRFSLVRVTVELWSPLTIGTGQGSDVVDSVCVTDANGLPTLPGSSVAGVLRAAWAQTGLSGERDLFGYQEGDRGASSRLEVSWGQTHDQNDVPVPFRGAPDDPVLNFLRGGVVRDQVAINHRGTVMDRRKFDVGLVPTGARFTLELKVHGEVEQSRADMDRLLSLFSQVRRLGGRTRRGYGEFKVVRKVGRSFDLTKPQDRKDYLGILVDLSKAATLKDWSANTQKPTLSTMQDIEVILTAEDYWLVGDGAPVREEHNAQVRGENEQKPHDRIPLTEQRVRWSNNNKGSVVDAKEAEVVLPASSVKGALRHRTLFHLRCLRQQWVEEKTRGSDGGDDLERHLNDEGGALECLFGSIREDEDSGRPGRVFLSDIVLAPAMAKSQPLQHVSLDRFTQGPMDGLLFSEAPIATQPQTLLSLKVRVQSQDMKDDVVREAFHLSLRDLVEGRLALGGGSAKGHGYFSGKIQGDGAAWLRGQAGGKA